VPNLVKTKVILREPARIGAMAHHQGAHTAGAGKDVYGQPVVADLAEMPPPAHRRQHRLRQIRFHQRHQSLRCSTVSRPTSFGSHD